MVSPLRVSTVAADDAIGMRKWSMTCLISMWFIPATMAWRGGGAEVVDLRPNILAHQHPCIDYSTRQDEEGLFEQYCNIVWTNNSAFISLDASEIFDGNDFIIDLHNTVSPRSKAYSK
eukprot:gb/GECG01008158.1/.p1 GENE.gb/GECG01008158.1/~~gb/GECG01008158.1/.p1  ORF type:complete len:118 (+),score=14.90 gb/GECG01008158.1/:1-354(+)